MKLSTFKNHLKNIDTVNFSLPGGISVPKHFHLTEAGLLTKQFVDCGGTIREEKHINFQIWVANDIEHRLAPNKILQIIDHFEKLFGNNDLEIEVEYQSDTIGKYGLSFQNDTFVLTSKQTDCLALDSCGISLDKLPLKLTEKESSSSCCAPGGGCC